MKYTKLSFLTLGLLLTGFSLNAQGGFVLFGGSGQAPAADEKFVRPLTGPYFHEDSFVTTDIRAWYVNHSLSTIGGDVTVMAVQARLALTDALQLVAYKDGQTDFSNDTGAGLGGNDGFNDIGAGLKWAFLQDWKNNFHLAAGLGYELGLGDDEVLQDTDELRLWFSANKGFGQLHLGAVINYLYAVDDSDGLLGNSDMVTVHLHADYFLNDWFSPVVELNGYFAQDDRGPPFSGVDAGSLPGGSGEDTITGALGFELRPLGPALGLRAAYETELSDSISLFGHRWTLSAVYEF